MILIKKNVLRLLLGIVAISITSSFNAQAQGFDLPVDYTRNSIQGNNVKLAKVTGSPYANENFVSGNVSIKDDSYFALLRYNAFNDEIQLKEDNNQIISLLKRNYIKASIDGENYAIHSFINDGKPKQGYFIEVTNADTTTKAVLLKRQRKVLIAAQAAKSSYKKGSPARLLNEEVYYLKIGESPAKALRLTKKNVLSAFGESKNDELKSYVSQNKLKLKKESEIINLIAYYNSI